MEFASKTCSEQSNNQELEPGLRVLFDSVMSMFELEVLDIIWLRYFV